MKIEMLTAKSILKNFIPPIFIKVLKFVTHKPTWSGSYSSWQNALEQCSGYTSPEILLKVSSSLKKVRAGEASYERDSVLFDRPLDHSGILASILYCNTKSKANLSVYDFGGSLGSTYFQFKQIFESLPITLSWNVIEQEHYVSLGKNEFRTQSLSFFSDIDLTSYKSENNCKVLIMSASLQYLQQPYEVLSNLLKSCEFDFVIMARIPLHYSKGSRLTIQNVSPSIYQASYPCWFFNESELLSLFADKYDLVTELNTPDTCDDFPSIFKGFFFEKRPNEHKT